MQGAGATPPLVSAIIVFLDAEKFLEEAIASVFAQTYENWELILVDDGSMDGSTGIARRTAARAPERVRYVEHPGHQNLGISAARNLGIALASGAFIGFLDADDVWLPQKLSEQVALLDTYPEAAAVYGRTEYWYSWDQTATDATDKVRPLGIAAGRLVEPPELLVRFLRQQALTPTTCSPLMRREAVIASGGFEAEFRGMFEDQVFFTKLALHFPVYVSGAVWDRYRHRPDSHCNTALREGDYDPKLPNPARERFLRWADGYLSREGVRAPRIRNAMNRALWPYRHPRLYAPVKLARVVADRVRRLVAR